MGFDNALNISLIPERSDTFDTESFRTQVY